MKGAMGILDMHWRVVLADDQCERGEEVAFEFRILFVKAHIHI